MRLGTPIAPSLKSKLVFAILLLVLLLLWFAWTNLDTPSMYGCTQGGNGTVGSRAVGEVYKAVAGVSRADGVDGNMDVLQVAKSILGKKFLDIVRFRHVG